MYDEISKKVAFILDHILKNPAVFFNEGDIQAMFYTELRQIERLKKLYKTGCTIGKNQNDVVSKQCYKTYLIHREYGINWGCQEQEKPKHRADLVIFNEHDIKSITHPLDLKKEDNSYLEPDYIFEFGTEKSAGSADVFGAHIENDLKKLMTANKRGFIIHVQRNYLLRGHSSANKEKYDKYISQIVENINRISGQTGSSKIIPLIFKVDIGNPGKRIVRKGKIQMFNGKKMKGINQKKLRESINEYLGMHTELN